MLRTPSLKLKLLEIDCRVASHNARYIPTKLVAVRETRSTNSVAFNMRCIQFVHEVDFFFLQKNCMINRQKGQYI